MNTTINHYDVLEIQFFASIEEVKTAFKKLSKMYHPDKNPEAEEKYKLIVEAKEILTDEEKKKAYDETLRIELNSNEQRNSVQTYSSDFTIIDGLKWGALIILIIWIIYSIIKSNK